MDAIIAKTGMVGSIILRRFCRRAIFMDDDQCLASSFFIAKNFHFESYAISIRCSHLTHHLRLCLSLLSYIINKSHYRNLVFTCQNPLYQNSEAIAVAAASYSFRKGMQWQ
ncbi:Uncharacterized protein TCM_004874 [Theobroma cacao]|uniref:Uncharacterized protein n=1 Tax=Theobroma cacao TaxID=3641 RepID=A0A061DSH2_THECC|nr:Uncharacterized protein TCM_004874 [Theobroma cacao]